MIENVLQIISSIKKQLKIKEINKKSIVAKAFTQYFFYLFLLIFYQYYFTSIMLRVFIKMFHLEQKINLDRGKNYMVIYSCGQRSTLYKKIGGLNVPPPHLKGVEKMEKIKLNYSSSREIKNYLDEVAEKYNMTVSGVITMIIMQHKFQNETLEKFEGMQAMMEQIATLTNAEKSGENIKVFLPTK